VEKVEELMDLEMDELITRPMNIALREKVNIETKFYDAHCIQIQLGEINILDFSFEEETKNRIIQKGRDAVLEYVLQKQPRKRRNSI
jgi:hypothetical protein